MYEGMIVRCRSRIGFICSIETIDEGSFRTVMASVQYVDGDCAEHLEGTSRLVPLCERPLTLKEVEHYCSCAQDFRSLVALFNNPQVVEALRNAPCLIHELESVSSWPANWGETAWGSGPGWEVVSWDRPTKRRLVLHYLNSRADVQRKSGRGWVPVGS